MPSKRKLLIEEWRQIEDFPKYKISNLGRVARGDRELKVMTTADKFKESYVILCKNKTRYKRSIARLVWLTFSDTKMKYTTSHVLHFDRDPQNNRIDNLFVALTVDCKPSKEQVAAYEKWCLPSVRKYIKDQGLRQMHIDVDNFVVEATLFLWKYLPLYRVGESSFLAWGYRYIRYAFLKEVEKQRKYEGILNNG